MRSRKEPRPQVAVSAPSPGAMMSRSRPPPAGQGIKRGALTWRAGKGRPWLAGARCSLARSLAPPRPALPHGQLGLAAAGLRAGPGGLDRHPGGHRHAPVADVLLRRRHHHHGRGHLPGPLDVLRLAEHGPDSVQGLRLGAQPQARPAGHPGSHGGLPGLGCGRHGGGHHGHEVYPLRGRQQDHQGPDCHDGGHHLPRCRSGVPHRVLLVWEPDCEGLLRPHRACQLQV